MESMETQMTSIFSPDMEIDDKVILLRLIDTGGQAEVWAVRDTNFPGRSELALKIFHTPWEYRNDPNFVRRAERLEQEYRIVGRIQHRFIVSPHFRVAGPFEKDGERYYISGLAMDLASEGSLQDFILGNSYKRFGNRDKLIFLRRLAEGLEAIHSFQIVHNDIKTKNVLVSRETNQFIPRFSDFGISFRQGDAAIYGGTPAYLAPEVISRKGSPSFQSDIFSLGVVFYEFALGRHPLHFLMEKERDLMNFFAGYYDTHEYLDVSEINTFESPIFTQMIQRMCSSDPDARPTIAEIRRTIDQIELDFASTYLENIDDTVPSLINKFKWSAAIHDLFDEKEYFFFITGARPDQDSIWLSSQLSQKRIFGYSIFRLVGSNDYLLRIWLRQSSLYYLTRILEDYQRQKFGNFKLFVPNGKFPEVSIDRKLQVTNATQAIRLITALIPDGNLDESAVKKYQRQKIIVGMTKTHREAGFSEPKRKIRVMTLITTKASMNERFAQLVAKDIYDRMIEIDGVSEVEVFSFHGKDGIPGEFLALCELISFHRYQKVFEVLEKSLTEISADLVSQFRTHFELDAISAIESEDGCLIYEASRAMPRV
jgi:serine/threonine protein kinase